MRQKILPEPEKILVPNFTSYRRELHIFTYSSDFFVLLLLLRCSFFLCLGVPRGNTAASLLGNAAAFRGTLKVHSSM